MSPEEFQRHVEAFSDRGVWELAEREPPLTSTEIKAYEREHGFQLPPEYVHVAGTYGCGMFAFAELLSLRVGPWSIDAQRALSPGLPGDFVPISGNGCGDFYGFIVSNGQCERRILFADHEDGYALSPTEFADLYEYLYRHGLDAA